MMYETEKDLNAKAKRVAELPGLIELAALELGVVADGEKPKIRAKRAKLMQEKLWYENGHPFAEWPTFVANMEAKERASVAAAAERAKAEAERKAKSDEEAAERDAQLRAGFEAERDEFLQWKRAKASRTF